MNRRTFIKTGMLFGISPQILHAIEKTSTKKCVFIFLGGGISHIEFINPIPEAPVEYRSTTGSIATKSGYQIGGSFTNLAKCSELFTTVRSFSHRDANHNSAAHWVNTGKLAFNIGDMGRSIEPSYGSIVCHEFSPTSKLGMPHYVKVNPIPHDDASWLGAKYMGYDNDSEMAKAVKANKEKFKRRIDMLNIVNKGSEKLGNDSKLFKDWGEIRNLASDIINGDASAAFDVSLEPNNIRESYKEQSSVFGRSLLTARRLIENDCKFVTVANNGWDHHSDIKANFENQASELDHCLSTFLLDLSDRGLLKDTLVVITSEFGRTPKLNNGSGSSSGRDHYPSVNSLILAGGSYGNNLIGETDSKASTVVSDKFSPGDLSWTIMNHFGIDKTLMIVDNQKRPRFIFDKESKLII